MCYTEDPERVANHSLKIKAGSKVVKQRLRRFNDEKRRAIEEGVGKLIAVGFISEVLHPDWLANPILASRHGSTRSLRV